MSAKPMKPLTVVLLASVSLSACADLYYDRRDAVHLSFGDANASNIAVQTIDPWPRHAANREILMNGEVAQKTIQRYKEGKVTPPKGLGTSSIQIEANPAAAPTP
jgi:hypothetical protein